MSVVSVTDVGYGAPLRITFRVSAIGSTDAAEQAKIEARSRGYKVKTLGRIMPGQNIAGWSWKTERGDWLVELVCRPPLCNLNGGLDRDAPKPAGFS